jgi:hypothetical protein
LDDALRVLKASYDLDPEWSGCDKYVEQSVIAGAKRALAAGGECLFVLHGNRVIAASVYHPEPAAGDMHLVSGPCVLIEYRSRGIGGSLLGATLEALRARGLSESARREAARERNRARRARRLANRRARGEGEAGDRRALVGLAVGAEGTTLGAGVGGAESQAMSRGPTPSKGT